jgi:hypothetical protein
MSIYAILLLVLAWLFARILRRFFARILRLFARRHPKRGEWSDL